MTTHDTADDPAADAPEESGVAPADASAGSPEPTREPTDASAGSAASSDGSVASRSPDGEPGTPTRSPLVGRDRLTALVVAIAVLALGLRLFDLGLRVAHWEEARLGWWIAEYADAGDYTRNPAVGGSLLQVLGRLSTSLLGTGDLAIRAPVAIAGGLVPVGALAFRRRLDDGEVLALAGLLAVAPLLVYYTRFASVDAIAAVLALATVAIVLAARERPRPELVLAAVVLGVLAVAAEPTAGVAHLLALLVAWGAALMYVPPATFATGGGGKGADSDGGDGGGSDGDERLSPFPAALVAAWESARRVAVATGVVLLIVLLDPDLPGALLGALTSPGALPGVLLGPVVALLDHLWLVVEEFFAAPGTAEAGIGLLGTLVGAAPVVTGLAVVGGLAEHWADRPPRAVVTLGLVWAALGVPLQLIVSGSGAPWVATHVVVALAVPAAVGAVAVWRWTRRGLATGDPLTGGAGVLACLFAVALVLAALASGVYLAPTDPAAGPVQYGQPTQDLRGPLDALGDRETAAGTPDLVLYGAHFVDPAFRGLEPRCTRWYNAQPLPWYVTVTDADVECTTRPATLRRHVESGPTLVVGRERALGPFAGEFDNYTARTLRFRAWNANATVLVHRGS